MDYNDLTQAALEALHALPSPATATQNQEEAHRLRGRILGVLIRRGRLAAQRSVDDCAAYLQVDAQLIEAWEHGAVVPGLPQLEGLTRCLLAAAAGGGPESAEADRVNLAEYYLLRQRMIGAKLKLARKLLDLEIADLARSSGLNVDLIERYESGEVAVPMNHLCVLAQAVGQDLRYFMHAARTRRGQKPSQSAGAAEAPADKDLVRFAADDKNQDYIRLAMAFRQIDRQDLQRIAEALYNIIGASRDANGRSPATP